MNVRCGKMATVESETPFVTARTERKAVDLLGCQKSRGAASLQESVCRSEPEDGRRVSGDPHRQAHAGRGARGSHAIVVRSPAQKRT